MIAVPVLKGTENDAPNTETRILSESG